MFVRTLKFLVLGCLAASAFAQTTTSTATRPLPPIGLASTETLQINLLNHASASSTGTAASCTGSVSFANSSGTAIGSATSFTISGGDVTSIALPYSKSGLTGRGEIVVSVTLSLASGTPCALASSLETFDTSSGVTHIYVPGGGFGGGPVFGGGASFGPPAGH